MNIKCTAVFFALSLSVGVQAGDKQIRPYNNAQELMRDINEKISGELERVKKSIAQLNAEAKDRNDFEVQQHIERLRKHFVNITNRYHQATKQKQTELWSQRAEPFKKFNSFVEWYNAKNGEFGEIEKTLAKSLPKTVNPTIAHSPSSKTQTPKAVASVVRPVGGVQSPPIIAPQGGIRVMPE